MNARTTALAAASGLLLAVSFPVLSLWFFAWIAFIPLFLALKDQSPKNGFRIGLTSGIVYFTGTVYWVTNSIHFYGHIPLLPASLITLLLCAYLALYPAVFGAGIAYFRYRRPDLIVLFAPCLWTVLELARTYIFSGFPWSLLGYSQYHILPVIQIADITAVYGVSFLIVLVNAAAAEFIVDRKRVVSLFASLLTLAAVLGYGWMRMQEPELGSPVTISVVQGNIEQDKKWDPAYQAEVISVYKRLTLEAHKQQPDIAIWPETATPFYFNGDYRNDKALTDDLSSFIRQHSVPLLTGSPTFERMPNRRIVGKNSAFLLGGDGTVLAQYDKVHLVPFGEYVPLKKVFFFVDKLVQAIGDFEAGTDYTVMKFSSGAPDRRRETRICTVICYEVIFPDLVRRFMDNGAEVLTTVTNDAWFGATAAPFQHFSMAVFRAVENRVPVARAANTGISGFIDTHGRILAASGIFTEATLTRTVRTGTVRTLYTKCGDLFAYLCVIAGSILLILPSRR